jgi:DNA polymerase/3'-5' exonuclease PolX
MLNEKIIIIFEQLAKRINQQIIISDKQDKLKHIFRLNAITYALKIIRSYPKEITSSRDLMRYNGIGKGILRRIDEIVGNGNLAELYGYSEQEEVVEMLSNVIGINAVLANQLVNKYNIKSINDLINVQHDVNLPQPAQMGLKYYNTYERNIPRRETKDIDSYINDVIISLNKKYRTALKYKICGSYRRRQRYSNDIDILLTNKLIKTFDDLNSNINFMHVFVKYLTNYDNITDVISMGNHKTFAFWKYKRYPIRKIDIQYVQYNAYYTSVMYFTGSKEFNIVLRKYAKRNGFKLNEYELINKNTGKKIKIGSEYDVFNALRIKYIKPRYRRGVDDIVSIRV